MFSRPALAQPNSSSHYQKFLQRQENGQIDRGRERQEESVIRADDDRSEALSLDSLGPDTIFGGDLPTERYDIPTMFSTFLQFGCFCPTETQSPMSDPCQPRHKVSRTT